MHQGILIACSISKQYEVNEFLLVIEFVFWNPAAIIDSSNSNILIALTIGCHIILIATYVILQFPSCNYIKIKFIISSK